MNRDLIDEVENYNRSNIAMHRFSPIQTSDKQWAVAIQQGEKPLFGRRILRRKVNIKLRREAQLYKFVPSKCSIWLSSGRILLNPLHISLAEEPKLHDPYQKFVPSQHLVELAREHMIHPDEEVLELIEEIKKIRTEVVDQRQNISSMITKQVEGLLTNLAKRIFRIKKPIRITKDNRFTSVICIELIDRLGLDVYNPRPVLELLYNELYKFVLLTHRERSWGEIIIENSEIKLRLKGEAFKFPELAELENRRRY